MSPFTLRSGLAASLVVAFSFAAVGSAAAVSGPDTENGRYTLSQSGDSFIRLDTRSGAVSSCSNNGNGWACYAVPDERKAMDDEIGRLQAENEKLKAQLAAGDGASSGKTDEALPKSDQQVTPKADSQRKIEIPLPSDADVDRVMSFLERAWRRLVDMANQMQKDAAGKI